MNYPIIPYYNSFYTADKTDSFQEYPTSIDPWGRPTEEFVEVIQDPREVIIPFTDPHFGNEAYDDAVNVHENNMNQGIDTSEDDNPASSATDYLPKSEEEKKRNSTLFYLVIGVIIYFLIK